MMPGGQLMPGIPLALLDLSGESLPPILGLVDSGADTSTFPLELAPALGIEIADCHSARGTTAGGTANQFVWEPGLKAVVVERTVTLKAVFSPTPIPLLGRADFFSEFRVAFDERGSRFQVTPY